MDVIEVRAAEPHEWGLVKAIRLRALADAPYAFASTLEREQAFDDAEWQRRVASGNWFVALAVGRPVGVAAGFSDIDIPGHQSLVAMWVQPDHRGDGTAERLVEAVSRWAQSKGATSLGLGVTDGNDRARRFYERLGFAPTGARAELPNAPGTYEARLCRSLPSVRLG